MTIALLAVVCAGFIVYNFRISEENVRLGGLNEQITRLNQAYERFVPREFVALLEKGGIEDVRLGDQVLQAMSVMFFDVIGFTSWLTSYFKINITYKNPASNCDLKIR